MSEQIDTTSRKRPRPFPDQQEPTEPPMNVAQRRRLEAYHGLPADVWQAETIYDWAVLGQKEPYIMESGSKEWAAQPYGRLIEFQKVIHEKHKGQAFRPINWDFKPNGAYFRSTVRPVPSPFEPHMRHIIMNRVEGVCKTEEILYRLGQLVVTLKVLGIGAQLVHKDVEGHKRTTFTALILPAGYAIAVPVPHIGLMLAHALYKDWFCVFVADTKTLNPVQWLKDHAGVNFDRAGSHWVFGAAMHQCKMTETSKMSIRALNNPDFQMGLINVAATNASTKICTSLRSQVTQFTDKEMLMQPVASREDAKRFMHMDVGGVVLKLITSALTSRKFGDTKWLVNVSPSAVDFFKVETQRLVRTEMYKYVASSELVYHRCRLEVAIAFSLPTPAKVNLLTSIKKALMSTDLDQPFVELQSMDPYTLYTYFQMAGVLRRWMEAKAPHDMPNTFSNAILSGPAGVGKSTLIHAIMDALNGALFDNRSVFETQRLQDAIAAHKHEMSFQDFASNNTKMLLSTDDARQSNVKYGEPVEKHGIFAMVATNEPLCQPDLLQNWIMQNPQFLKNNVYHLEAVFRRCIIIGFDDTVSLDLSMIDLDENAKRKRMFMTIYFLACILRHKAGVYTTQWNRATDDLVEPTIFKVLMDKAQRSNDVVMQHLLALARQYPQDEHPESRLELHSVVFGYSVDQVTALVRCLNKCRLALSDFSYTQLTQSSPAYQKVCDSISEYSQELQLKQDFVEQLWFFLHGHKAKWTKQQEQIFLLHGAVNVMPLRLFRNMDLLTSMGVEAPQDFLQEQLFSNLDDPKVDCNRFYLEWVVKKKIHKYLHTDFSLDPFRRCGPWCENVTEGNCDGNHYFPFGYVRFALLSSAPWITQQRVCNLTGENKPKLQALKQAWDNVIPPHVKRHILTMRKGTRGNHTLDTQPCGAAVRWFDRNWFAGWDQLKRAHPILRYFERDLINGWYDSVKGYLLREVLSILTIYGPDEAGAPEPRRDLGEHIPLELINDTDVDGSDDAPYRIDVVNIPARLRMSKKGLESLKAPGIGFLLLIQELATSLTKQEGNIAVYGTVPQSQAPHYMAQREARFGVRDEMRDNLQMVADFYQRTVVVNPDIRPENLGLHYRRGDPLEVSESESVPEFSSEELPQVAFSQNTLAIIEMGDQLLAQQAVRNPQDLEEEKENQVRTVWGQDVSEGDIENEWQEYVTGVETERRMLHASPQRHSSDDEIQSPVAENPRMSSRTITEDDDSYPHGSSVPRSHSSQKDDPYYESESD